MESLVKAAGDFLAAVLSAVGFVGRPRRRAAILQDLQLLRELDQCPDEFGKDSWAHSMLTAHVELEVAKYTGVELPRRRRPWSAIILALIIGAPLAYLTVKLNDAAFNFYSLLPGAIATLMAISVLGMLIAPEEEAPVNGGSSSSEAADE